MLGISELGNNETATVVVAKRMGDRVSRDLCWDLNFINLSHIDYSL